jgi:hypothetical protein
VPEARRDLPAAPLALAAIPVAGAAVAIGSALRTNNWTAWGVWPMESKIDSGTSFADLANITSTAQCISRGWDFTTCDPYGRLFQPYVVLPARVLAAVGADMSATAALGIALAACFVVGIAILGAAVALRWRGSLPGLLVAMVVLALAAVAPPTMLAVERGQVELLTFALACLGLVLLPAQRAWVRVIGAVAAIAAVVTKFVALGALAPVVQRRRPSRIAIGALVGAFAFCLVMLPDVIQASRAARTSEPGTTRPQLGAATLPATWLSADPIGNIPDAAVVDHWGLILTVSALATVAAVVVSAVLLGPRRTAGLDAQPAARWLVVGGTGILLPVYVLGLAHDYRLIFLLPALAGLCLWAGATRGAERIFAVVLSGCAFVAIATGAAMIAAPGGVLLPRVGLVAGDVALFVTLVAGGGIWLRGLVSRPVPHDA